MSRKVLGVVLIGLFLLHAPVLADSGREQAAPPTKSRSTTKRVVWTVIGAGAGFAAGVFIGLNRFDDAINSDRKVWTTAIVGAIGGGVAGGLLSRNVGMAPAVAPGPVHQRSYAIDLPWASAISAETTSDHALRARVRSVNDGVKLP